MCIVNKEHSITLRLGQAFMSPGNFVFLPWHFLSLVSHIGWQLVKGHFVIWREAGEGITSFEAKTEPKHARPRLIDLLLLLS